MIDEFRKTRLRIELEIVPIEDSNEIQEVIKDKFNTLLIWLMESNLINMHHGASMTVVDVTPIQWRL